MQDEFENEDLFNEIDNDINTEDTPPLGVGEDEVIPFEGNITDTILSRHGITDGVINYEGEDIAFTSLPEQEQYNIISELLNSGVEQEQELTAPMTIEGLSEDQSNFIQFLATEGITVDQFIDSIQKDAYVSNGGIDQFSDEALFKIHLAGMDAELTEEDINAEYEARVQSPLFKKELEKLRSDYKAQDEADAAATQNAEVQKQQEVQQAFQKDVIDTISALNSFNEFEIEDDIKQELVEDIFVQDETTGLTNLGVALNDPEKLLELAWFNKYGKDAFAILEEEIENARNEGIAQGKAEALKGYPTKPKSGNILMNTRTQNNNNSQKDSGTDEVADLWK